MLEETIADIFRELIEDVKLNAEEIVIIASGLEKVYREASRIYNYESHLNYEINADNVMMFGRNAICFQRILALEYDEEYGEFVLSDDFEEEGKKVIFDAQIQFTVINSMIRFSLNLCFTGIKNGCSTGPVELMATAHKDGLAEELRKKVGDPRIDDLVQSASEMAADVIREEAGIPLRGRYR